MFKKVLMGISVAAILATGASAMDFCKTAENLFLGDGLEQIFKKHNSENHLKACDVNVGTIECRGYMRASEKIANAIFNKIGAENVITMFNKFGVKQNYTKTQIYINFSQFFKDYLFKKLNSMNENDRKIFLTKLYLFLNRVPDEIINFDKEKIANFDLNLFYSGIFKKPLVLKDKNIKTSKEILNLGALAFLSNYQGKGQDVLSGAALFAYIPRLSLADKIFGKFGGYSDKDPQLGGSAENLEKFFVYAATKQYDKAYNLINKTYSDNFIKELQEDIKEVCNIN